MDPKRFHRRALALVLLLGLVILGMSATLYDMQINEGDEYYRRSQYKIAETQSVEAARGQILDRNGQILVTNRVVYQVKLDPKLMGEDRNEILIQLIQAARASGVAWTDTLPITQAPPFAFTVSDPFTFLDTAEDGSSTLRLTRLGRLSVRMGWIKDPTKSPESPQAAAPEEPGFFDKLKAFFTGKEPDPPAPPPPRDEPLPSAQLLLGRMCQSFNVRGPGAIDPKKAGKDAILPSWNVGTMPPADARALAGILYELNLRSKEIYQVPYLFAEDVGIDFITRVKELALPGVAIESTSVRQYNTPYAAHLLGRVTPIFREEWDQYKDLDLDGDGKPDYQKNDTVGRDGAEKAFESYLRGTPGIRTVERNTRGKVVSSTWLEEPKPGGNVVLTLDIGLQAKVEETLAQMVPQLPSKDTEGAACVILDVNNSDVLAAASYPTFDLATFSQDYNDLANDPLKPMLNRAFQGLSPPGSTFKPVTAIGALEEGIITPKTIINTKGKYTYYPGPAPRCWIYREHGRTHGPINVTEAIKVSCNYFMFDIGRRLGIERLQDYAARFGLGERTGLELYEEKGVMAGPEFTESLGGTWYEGNVLSVAIGQESSQFTPIQLANYTATLVNGGTRNATHLLKEVKSSDFTRVLDVYDPRVLSTVEITPKNLDAVKAGMLDLTADGSVAKYFQDLGISVGAKTGSAQVNRNTEANSLFICFAPYDKPEIAMAIVVEKGGGGSNLGGMAAEILSYYFSAQENLDEVPPEQVLLP